MSKANFGAPDDDQPRCRRIRFHVLLLLSASLLFVLIGWASPGTAEAASVRIVLNGQELASDTAPEILHGRTMVPIRVVSEAAGARVDWLDSTRNVLITRDGRILLTIDSVDVRVRNEWFVLDVAPYINNGRSMLPLRFISEAFGAEVSWDTENRTVAIVDPPPVELDTVPERSESRPEMPAVARIDEIVHRVHGGAETVTITGDPIGVVTEFTLSSPNRIVLDFPATEFNGVAAAESLVPLAAGAGLIRQVRTGEPVPDAVRVVVELNGASYWRQTKDGQALTITVSETLPSLAGLHIMIDPGHGGKDTGAIGPTGLLEKDVNLAVSRLTADLLRVMQARVSMIRDSDVYIDRHERPQIADRAGADLFLSIHHNGASNRAAVGTETFFRRANDMPSRLLAEAIHSEVMQVVPGPDRRVRMADFAVLVGTAKPAALIEIDFITNFEREQLSRNPEFQKRVAAAMARGIARYWTGFQRIGG